MTFYLALAILVSVVAVISIILDRRWQTRQATKLSEPVEEEKIDSAGSSRIKGKFRAVRDSFGRRKQAKLAKQLQTWAATNITDNDDLKDWFNNLSADGVTALTGQLSLFCSDLNLELDWLFGSELDEDPELKVVAERIVAAYCSACWQAAIAQGDLEVSFLTLVRNLI